MRFFTIYWKISILAEGSVHKKEGHFLKHSSIAKTHMNANHSNNRYRQWDLLRTFWYMISVWIHSYPLITVLLSKCWIFQWHLPIHYKRWVCKRWRENFRNRLKPSHFSLYYKLITFHHSEDNVHYVCTHHTIGMVVILHGFVDEREFTEFLCNKMTTLL